MDLAIILFYDVVVKLVFIIIAFILYNFPWISKYWKIEMGKISVMEDNKIVFVSDIHLGVFSVNSIRILSKIIEKLKARVIVFVGDLIDKRFMIKLEDLEKIARALIHILNLRDAKVIYIPSNSAHDIFINGWNGDIIRLKLDYRNIEFIIAPYILKIELNNCREYIYATHGDYFSRDGVLAYLFDKISRRIFRKLFTGVAIRKILNLDNNIWILVGHSHTALIDHRYKVLGLGCWISRLYAPRESVVAIARCRKDKTIELKFIEIAKHRKT